MSKLAAITQDTAVFPWQQRTPLEAVETLPAILLALVLGQRTGHPAAGAIAAGAAYTIGFAVFHEALASRLLSMALITAGIASATLIGSLAAPWTLAVMLVAVAAAFNYGLLSGLGPTASWIGQNCGVYAIVTSFFAHGPSYAVGRAAMVVLGGALQMLVYAALCRIRRPHRPHAPVTQPHVPVTRQLRTRVLQLARTLRDEFTWTASTTAYTVRLVLALLLATAAYRHYGLHNGYWAPMTALLVLKPQWISTLSRGIARTLGTMAGAALALLTIHLHPAPLPHGAYLVLIVAFAWISLALQAVNYAAFSGALTLYIVFLFAFGGFSQRSAAEIRLAMTALGGSIALLVDIIWLAFVRLHPEHPAARAEHPAVLAERAPRASPVESSLP